MSDKKQKPKLTVEQIKRLASPDELELYSYIYDKAQSVADEIVDLTELGLKSGEGGLLFVYGPIYSGKTLVACLVADRLDKGKTRVTPIQPEVDRPDVPTNRYWSRSGVERKVTSVTSKQDLMKVFNENDVVIIDEMQFFDANIQSFLLKLISDYIKRGGWVVAVGMLYTSQASEFLLSAVLKDRAIKSFGLTATCLKCGARGARLNQRIVNGVPTSADDPELLAPSQNVSYEPRCDDCHVIIG